MHVWRNSELEINATMTDSETPSRVRVVVQEVWVEVENGNVIPWIGTITKDEIQFPYTLRLTPENISKRNITFIS